MNKLFERYGKREVITNIVIGLVLVVLTIGLGFSYYIKHDLNQVDSSNSSSGTEVVPTPTENTGSEEVPDSNQSSDNPVSTDSPVISPTPVPTEEPEAGVETFTNESQVISFFESQSRMIDSYQSSDGDATIMERVKSTFVTVVDFLFYNQPIGGYTFSQLTNSAKVQVIKIALSIDNKIDEYFPGYKDVIKSGYTSIKAKLVKVYLDTTALLCEKVGDTTCNQAKEDFITMKDSFGFTFDLIKEAGGNLVEAIKTWYEIFRES